MNNYYSLLGIGRQATTAEIANAYRQILMREMREKGTEADLGLYSQAYRTLTIPSKRQEYDRLLDRIAGRYVIKNQGSPTEAEKCYLAGLTCLEQKNFQDAVDYLYRAVQLEPEESHFCSQLGLALGMFSDKLDEAERYCKKAIELDPDNPEFYFNLGFLYQRHNLVDAAQSAFDHANEAIKKREARILGQSQPLVTPWETQGLMEEGARIESLVQEMGTDPTRQETGSAAAAGDDLLKQISDLEAQITVFDRESHAAMLAEEMALPAAEEGIAGWSSDDDLLKELDILEAQVRGVEDLYGSGVDEKTEASAPPVSETAPSSKAGPDIEEPAFSLPLDYRTIGNFRLTEEEILRSPAGDVAYAAPEGQQRSPIEGKSPLSGLPKEDSIELQSDATIPETIRSEVSARQYYPDVFEVPVEAKFESSSEARDRTEAWTDGFPTLPAREKLRMLEALEREMMEELDRLRMERQKIVRTMQG